MAESRWRRAARRVIEETLAALPPGTSAKDKLWLAEARKALGAAKVKAKPPTPTVRVVLDTSFGLPVPRVACGWCKCGTPGHEDMTGGCLACSDRTRQARQRRETTDWRAWADWARLAADDPSARPAFADWLEENGWPEDAALVRRGG